MIAKQKRKTFIVPHSESTSLEGMMWQEFKQRKIPLPSMKEIKNEQGVSVRDGKLFLDLQRFQHSKIFAHLKLASSLLRHPATSRRLINERLAVIKQLKGLGYDVRVPVYKEFRDREFYPKAKRLGARTFNAETPIVGSFQLKPDGKRTVEIEPSVLWTRDLWVKFGGKRVKRFSRQGENLAGEGGMIVQAGSNSFIANELLKNNHSIQELQRQGAKFYFTINGFCFHESLSKVLGRTVYSSHDHVDMFLGVAGNLMLVDRGFYGRNSGILKEAAWKEKLKIILIPEEEEKLQPANFLVLEPNKVLVERSAKKTISLLRQNGVEVVPTIVSMRANRFAGGGVRCIVNEL